MKKQSTTRNTITKEKKEYYEKRNAERIAKLRKSLQRSEDKRHDGFKKYVFLRIHTDDTQDVKKRVFSKDGTQSTSNNLVDDIR
jgi:hypothetical protein